MSTDKADAMEASPLESSAHRKKMYNCAIFLEEPACTELRKCLSFIDALMARTQPDGYVLAPVEPTPAMSAAGFIVSEAEHDPAGVYRAMIAAAQEGK